MPASELQWNTKSNEPQDTHKKSASRVRVSPGDILEKSV